MKELDGKQLDGRAISVTKARPKSDGGGGGSYSRDRGNRW
jgi:hypothetical protein